MITDAADAVVAALTAEGLNVAVRSGDITAPVVYLQIGAVSDLGATLTGGVVVTFWCFYIPVRGLDNLAADADALDRLYAALAPLGATELVTTRTSVTVNQDTWPCYRADAAVMALTPQEA